VAVSAHTLRHTFALGYLRDNPGKLVELATSNEGPPGGVVQVVLRRKDISGVEQISPNGLCRPEICY
jgi:integrase